MATLYLMLGYPGSGKTTVAHIISELTGAHHVWADQERYEQLATPTYSADENEVLYSGLNAKTAKLLEAGASVIFDTAFNHFLDREKLRRIAQFHQADTVVVWVQAPRHIAKERATTQSHHQPTRKLGDMHHEQFELLSDKLEEPRLGENTITLDGTNITKSYVSDKLSQT